MLQYTLRARIADCWASLKGKGQMAEFVGNDYRLVLHNEVPVTQQHMDNLFANHPVYVLGYGSLLYEEGWYRRHMYLPPEKDELIECELKGYERGPWGLYDVQNFYGVIRTKGKSLNGVLVRIHTLRDWIGLMTTEMIVGLYRYANYRVVDVTKSVPNLDRLVLPNARVHLVCNRPGNRKKMLESRPSWGYYDRVWKGVQNERTPEFSRRFLETGGFMTDQNVHKYLEDKRKEAGIEFPPRRPARRYRNRDGRR